MFVKIFVMAKDFLYITISVLLWLVIIGILIKVAIIFWALIEFGLTWDILQLFFTDAASKFLG